MSRLENQTMPPHFRAVPYNASSTISAEVINASAGVLHSILISSHSGLTFKLWNSATGAGSPIGGTYTPSAGSQIINFTVPIEFSNGLYITTAPANSFLNGALQTGLTLNIN